MKSFASLVWLLVLGSTLYGQTVPPALMIQQDGRSVPLGLAKLQTDVRVVGAIAETTATMTFTNPLERIMEGYLYFPLPEGATVSSYALDINGAMVDGVAVGKYEARRVFEELERRRIDPGLVEWTKPNTFQARVFPIPAHGSRVIRVGYISELIRDHHGVSYRLPLPIKNKLPEFSLRVEVVRRSAPPQVINGNIHQFTFAKWRNGFVAEATLRNWKPEEDLVIALPKVDRPQVAVEKADDGQCYFAIDAEPEVPWNDQPVPSVKRVVVFWDASGSRAGDHHREIALLRQILNARIRSNVSHSATIMVDLVLVRNAVAKPLRFRFSKSAIAAALEEITYDGGTQLGAVGPLPGANKPDLYLLFTDGHSNFGHTEPAGLDAPLDIFCTSSTAPHSQLQSLAADNGGQYFDLSRQTDADILASLSGAPWAFLSVAVNGGEAENLYPRLPQPSADRLILAGKLAADDATVTLRYGVRGGESLEESFKVSKNDAVDGSLLRRLWAQKRLADLMVHAQQNKNDIITLGQEFGLVTPFTSLLVLDSLDQYVQYRVPPPKSLPSMREQYLQRVGNLDSLQPNEQAQKQREQVQTRRVQANQITELFRLWEQRVEWWETKFKHRSGFKYSGESKGPASNRTTPHTSVRGPENPGAGMAGAGMGMGSGIGGMGSGIGGMGSGIGGMGGSMGGMGGGMGGMRSGTGPTRSSQITSSNGSHRGTSRGPTLPPNQASPIPTGDLREAREGERSDLLPTIAIQAWNPDASCLKALDEVKKGKGNLWTIYSKHRTAAKNSPAFFLDFSDRFREAGNVELALQVLSNIAELELDDATLLRALGYRLLKLEQTDLAVWTFEQVLELRPEEPQSCRDLALALAHRADEARDRSHSKVAIRADYARAIDLFVRMLQSRSDGVASPIRLIALEEVNQIIPRAKAAGVTPIRLPQRLIHLLDMDIRIVMTWQADGANIDPAITEPSSEIAYDKHSPTTIGGLVSLHSAQGYGLEEYAIHKAATGKYKIEINYYGSGSTRLLGATTVQADVFTNYGRPDECHKSLIVRLHPSRETISLGEIEFPASGPPTFRMP